MKVTAFNSSAARTATRPNVSTMSSLGLKKRGIETELVQLAGRPIHVFDTINHFFTIGQMIIPGSSYWNIGVGRNIGDVENDEEGARPWGIWARTWLGC